MLSLLIIFWVFFVWPRVLKPRLGMQRPGQHFVMKHSPNIELATLGTCIRVCFKARVNQFLGKLGYLVVVSGAPVVSSSEEFTEVLPAVSQERLVHHITSCSQLWSRVVEMKRVCIIWILHECRLIIQQKTDEIICCLGSLLLVLAHVQGEHQVFLFHVILLQVWWLSSLIVGWQLRNFFLLYKNVQLLKEKRQHRQQYHHPF